MTPLPIGHVDIATTDPAGSARFFADLLGWEVGSHGNGYATFGDGRLSGGFPDVVNGFGPVRDRLSPGDVLLYVEVPDLDAALRRVVELGGAVVLGATESAPGTWLALVRSPQGTTLALTHIER